MAKNNNLTDYLTDLANAIREKKGTTDPINPQDFSAEIASIETGGGGESGGGGAAASANAINFRDYDGTILHSFSKDEFRALTELPPLPTQKGLICQEWNWTLEDAKAHVQEYGRLEVGATYITDDGKTRFYVTISDTKRDFPLKFSISKANSLIINWGDGSIDSVSSSGTLTQTHTYGEGGNYVISLEVSEGATLTLGSSSSTSYVPFALPYSSMLTKVECGERLTFSTRSFGDCRSLSSVVIPNNITAISSYMFQNCVSLPCVVLPSSVTAMNPYCFDNCRNLSMVIVSYKFKALSMYCFNNCSKLASLLFKEGGSSISDSAFMGCISLSSIVIPSSITSIGSYAFRYCRSLSSIVIPKNIKSIGTYAFDSCEALLSVEIQGDITTWNTYAFYNCTALRSVLLSNGITTIGSYAFEGCVSLTSIVIPSSVTTISFRAFYGCKGIGLVDFRSHTSVPTLGNVNVFTNMSNYKIVVPDALYEEWIAASNWSSYASNIVKASEYTE